MNLTNLGLGRKTKTKNAIEPLPPPTLPQYHHQVHPPAPRTPTGVTAKSATPTRAENAIVILESHVGPVTVAQAPLTVSTHQTLITIDL